MKKIVLVFLPLVAMMATTLPVDNVAITTSETTELPVLAVPEIVEIAYDEADPSGGWGLALTKPPHSMAVRFTPPNYPFDLTTVLYAAGAWGDNPDAWQDPFDIVIYSAGFDGAPATELGRLEDQTPVEDPWSEFDVTSLDITIESGDFFFAVECIKDYGELPGYPSVLLDFAKPVHHRSWLYTTFIDGEGNEFDDWLSFDDFGLGSGWPDDMAVGDSVDAMMRVRGDAEPIGIVELDPSGVISVSSKLVASEGTIDYTLPVAGDIDITVWDAAGRHVETVFSGHAEAGPHSLVWDGDAGIYFVQLRTSYDVAVAKLVVVN